MRVVDELEVVEVQQDEPQRLPEAARALDLVLERLVEAAPVRQPRQLVGHGLALDRLVQAGVLDRHRRLVGEVVEQRPVAVVEGLAAAGDGDDAGDRAAITAAQRRAERLDPVDGDLGGPAGVEGRALGRVERRLDAVERPRHGNRVQAAAALAAQRAAAGVGLDAIEHRADRDLEQPLAVEAAPERLAHAGDRPLEAVALLVELMQARLELRRHAVELDAERGELVVALRRHARGEVAAAQTLGGVEQLLDAPLQRLRRDDGEGQREDEEADQDRDREQPRPRRARRAQDRRAQDADARLGRLEVGRGLRAREPVAAADLHLPVARQVRRRGGAERRRGHAAVAQDDGLGAGQAPDSRGEGVGGRRPDLEPADVPPGGVEQLARRGKDRRRVAHVADRRAVARQQDARGAIGAAQRVEARAQGGAVAVADRRGHLAVLRDAGGDAVALGDGLLHQAGHRPLLRGELRAGLAGLARPDEGEDDEAHGHHRHEDDQEEEEREPTAEAHPTPECSPPGGAHAAAWTDRGLCCADLRGAIAQLGERLDRTQEVGGSSPPSSISSPEPGRTPPRGHGERGPARGGRLPAPQTVRLR